MFWGENTVKQNPWNSIILHTDDKWIFKKKVQNHITKANLPILVFLAIRHGNSQKQRCGLLLWASQGSNSCAWHLWVLSTLPLFRPQLRTSQHSHVDSLHSIDSCIYLAWQQFTTLVIHSTFFSIIDLFSLGFKLQVRKANKHNADFGIASQLCVKECLLSLWLIRAPMCISKERAERAGKEGMKW